MKLFLYKIYKLLTGNKPIFHLIIPNEDSKPIIVKEYVKFKVSPVIDDKIYFDVNGPFYKVTGITHNINTFHVIWVSVEKII